MAYLRKETETVEMAHSLDKVWAAIRKVLASPEWNIEQVDDTTHRAKAKMKGGFMSWGSVFLIDALPVNESTTKVKVDVETTVTTITAIVDLNPTRRRINLFFTELAKQLAN